jgi:DNA-binding SARP family transcriptional activator/tetratricopeptide (TPR) repeat protein
VKDVPAVEVRLLGPVEIVGAGRVFAVGPPQHRLTLAALAVDAGHPVGVEALIDRVWDDAPGGARRTLHVAIARLRRVLERAADGPAPLIGRSGGYVLDIDPDGVDALRLRGLLGGPPDAGRLREALHLWRGDPLAGLPGHWAERIRSAVLQDCVSAAVVWALAETAAGNPDAALGRLVELDSAHPLVEPVAAALMRVLHAAGRRAEALEHYATVRRRLLDELGADPGPELRDAHQELLADPVGVERRPVGVERRPVPAQLPAAAAPFTGREADLAALDAALLADDGMPQIAVITGAGGVGKTWLATRWALRHRQAFPDGQLFADLRGFDPTAAPVPPSSVLRTFLEGLGVCGAALPAGTDAQIGLYRSLVADRRMLIVLDNARDSAQVAPLLPGSPTGAVLVTSRERLTGLVAAQAATAVPLDVLDDATAHRLFRRRLDDRLIGRDPRAVEAIVAACAGLPLALGIAAARAAQQPHLGLAPLAVELRDAATRLNALEGDALANLRTVLGTTVAALAGPHRRAFALLGVAAGPDIGEHAATALLATRPGPAIRALEGVSLLHQHAPGRWRMHDLVRLYAVELAEDPDGPLPDADRLPALRRLVDFYLHSAFNAEMRLMPDRVPIQLAAKTAGVVPLDPPAPHAALEWTAQEYANLCATQRLADGQGWDDPVWQLAWALDSFHHRLVRPHDELPVWQAGLAAAERLGRPETLILALRLTSTAYVKVGDYTTGLAHLHRALTLAEWTGNLLEQARVHHALGYTWDEQGDEERGLASSLAALRIYEQLGRPSQVADVHNEVGLYLVRLGRLDEAAEHLGTALRGVQALGSDSEAAVLDSLGELEHARGRYAAAVDYFEQTLPLLRAGGDARNEAGTLERLGNSEAARGRLDAAVAAWRQALTMYEQQRRGESADRVRQSLARCVRAGRR